MSKPKLLLISGISPFPQTSGGATRIKQTLIHLSKKYEIHFYFFLASSQLLTAEEKSFLNQHTIFFKSFPLAKKSVLLSLKSALPYHFSNYFSQELIDYFKDLQVKTSFAQIRIESTQILYLAKYLSENQFSKFVALDISTVSFYRRAFASKNLLRILIRLLSCLQVYLYEKSLLRHFSKILVMSQKDAVFVKKLFALDKIQISPNGIEKINFLAPRTEKKIAIGFVGSVEHTPNHQALDYLLLEILPTLKQAQVNCEIIVLGKGNQDFYSNLSGVKFLDYVTDLKSFYEQIDILVAPIFAGSGTRLKVLESLSYGRPVFTTEIGAEGININSKLLSVISKSDDLKTWVEQIVKLASNREFTEIDQKDLKNQLTQFTWDEIFVQE